MATIRLARESAVDCARDAWQLRHIWLRLFAIRWKWRPDAPTVWDAIGSAGALSCECGTWHVEQARTPPVPTYLRIVGSVGMAAPAVAFVTLADQLCDEPVPAVRFAWSVAVHGGDEV